MVEMSSRKRPRTEDEPLSTFYAGRQSLRKTIVERTFMPEMNSYEYTDKHTRLTMVTFMIGLPGLQPGDVTINLLHDKMTISGRSFEPLLGEGMHILRELQHGKFLRVLTVPLGMKLKDFKACLENGLLMVTFPKHPPVQKPHRIPIEPAHVLDINYE